MRLLQLILDNILVLRIPLRIIRPICSERGMETNLDMMD